MEHRDNGLEPTELMLPDSDEAAGDTMVDRPRRGPSRAPGDSSASSRTWRISRESAEVAVPAEGVSEAPDLYPGLRVNQYELIRPLGRGGMGEVFLARDTRLGRLVAVKFLHRGDPGFLRRFWIEAKATAQCTHEHIVVIHEVGEFEGRPFMVLEYVEGDTLKNILSQGRLAWPRAVEIMVDVLEALDRAHGLGIVHRDLKPANIMVTSIGQVKVLDFGIAKLYRDVPTPHEGDTSQTGDIPVGMTVQGSLVGTVAYMAPEQAAGGAVGPESDIWAVGVILFECLTGKRPLAGMRSREVLDYLLDPTLPMPRVGQILPDVPPELEAIVARCLAKDRAERFRSAREVLDALREVLAAHRGGGLRERDTPFPGLVAFQETDADRFYGRRREVARTVARIREHPLVAVVGASGVGKSSLVRAGVIPALRRSGEDWEVFVLRPGRDPLAALAGAVEPATETTSEEDPELRGLVAEELAPRFAAEPGLPGRILRSRARRRRQDVLVFVDQLEEVFTLVEDPAVRWAFLNCLLAMADDPSSPIRVVVSMRSDLLDRAAEFPAFVDAMTPGLVFLREPDRQGLREALVEPVQQVGYRFEDPGLVERILDGLERSSGALPLLQFAAVKLWEARDRRRRLLTWAAYETMGGVEGALASHANEVLSGLAPAQQELARRLFLALVTSERTRAQRSLDELRDLLGAGQEVAALVDYFVGERLLVVHNQGREGAVVEIVHESLIRGWPTLRRWVEEAGEDTAFLEQLRNTARQWAARGRPQGLLWRGEAMQEAKRWYERHRGRLPPLEEEYLQAVFRLAARSRRIRNAALVSAFVFLVLLVAAAAVALVLIRNAERRQRVQAEIARREAARARAAEARIRKQIELIRAKEAERRAAEERARRAKKELAEKQERIKTAETALHLSYEELEKAYARVRKEKQRAQLQARRAEALARQMKELAERYRKLAEKERRRRQRAERRLKSVVSTLR